MDGRFFRERRGGLRGNDPKCRLQDPNYKASLQPRKHESDPQEDGVAHEKWLENEKLDSPTHPHISGDQFTSRSSFRNPKDSSS